MVDVWWQSFKWAADGRWDDNTFTVILMGIFFTDQKFNYFSFLLPLQWESVSGGGFQGDA